MKKNRYRKDRLLPFSHLTTEEQFYRLFDRGFTREEAEKKLRHPFKALLIPDQVLALWEHAKKGEQELDEVVEALHGFKTYRYINLLTYLPYDTDDLSILRGIASRVCGDEFDYDSNFLETHHQVFLTAYNGFFL